MIKRSLEIGQEKDRFTIWALVHALTDLSAKVDYAADSARKRTAKSPRQRVHEPLQTGLQLLQDLNQGLASVALPSCDPRPWDLLHVKGSDLAPQFVLEPDALAGESTLPATFAVRTLDGLRANVIGHR
jgi:hypothetical protein